VESPFQRPKVSSEIRLKLESELGPSVKWYEAGSCTLMYWTSVIAVTSDYHCSMCIIDLFLYYIQEYVMHNAQFCLLSACKTVVSYFAVILLYLYHLLGNTLSNIPQSEHLVIQSIVIIE